MFDEPGFPRDADLGDAATALETFVYCSRASEGVGDDEVDRIIEFSQRRNAARRVTGMLAFGNGVFFQWVEGPPKEIQDLITSLHGDSRHHDVVELERSSDMRERLYPGWEMERVEADEIRAVLLDALESAEDKNNVAALKRILEHVDAGPLASLGQV